MRPRTVVPDPTPLEPGETWVSRMRAVTLEEILERIAGGAHMFEVAQWLDVPCGALLLWIARHEDIRIPVAEARKASASRWDEAGADELQGRGVVRPGEGEAARSALPLARLEDRRTALW